MKIKLLLLSVMFALSFMFFSISPAPASAASGSAVTKMLPESTDVFLQFTSVQKMFDYFAVTKKSVWGEPIKNLENIQSELGFNPFDLDEFTKNGFDVTQPLGMAISNIKTVETGEDPNLNMILFFPAKNGQKAMEWIKKSIEKKDKTIKFQKQGKMWKWELKNEPEEMPIIQVEDSGEEKDATGEKKDAADEKQAASDPEENEPLKSEYVKKQPCYMMTENGYVFLGTNPAGDAKTLFENMGNVRKSKTGTLATVPNFLKVMKNINASKDIFFYSNLERIIKQNPESMDFFSLFFMGTHGMDTLDDGVKTPASLQMFKDYRAVGVTADLKSSDFKANCYFDVIETSKMFTLFKNVKIKRDVVLGLKENPVMLMALTENMQSYWQMLQETFDPKILGYINDLFAKIKTDYGVDMEADVISNMGTNFNAGIYDGMSINMGNVNALFSIEFKDPAKMRSVIETFIGKVPEQQQVMVNRLKINDSDVYMVPMGPLQLYAGFKDNNLLVTLGKPMFEKALNADPAKGFMASGNQDKALKNSLKNELSISYIDIKELFYIVKNFMPMFMQVNPGAAVVMQPEFQKLMDMFKYISSTWKVEKNGFKGDLVIKTNFDKPFLKGVKDVSDQVKAMKVQ